MDFSVKELWEKDYLEDLETEKYYAECLEQCKAEILVTHKNFSTRKMLFTIPKGIVQTHKYNYFSCVRYLITHLRQAGFFVRYLKDRNSLWISWSDHKKNERVKDDMKFVMKEDLKLKNDLDRRAKRLKQSKLTNIANKQKNNQPLMIEWNPKI